MGKVHGITQDSLEPSQESDSSSSPTPRKIYETLKPQFTEFPCRWKGCRAVLMNLESLKKHLSVVHSHEAQEHLRCQWDKCGRLNTPVFFSKLSDVDGHVMERHIQELAWRLGDGVGGVVGRPMHPEYSMNPPLHLFRKGTQAKALEQDEKAQVRVDLPM